jgi:hypothetical protein
MLTPNDEVVGTGAIRRRTRRQVRPLVVPHDQVPEAIGRLGFSEPVDELEIQARKEKHVPFAAHALQKREEVREHRFQLLNLSLEDGDGRLKLGDTGSQRPSRARRRFASPTRLRRDDERGPCYEHHRDPKAKSRATHESPSARPNTPEGPSSKIVG